MMCISSNGLGLDLNLGPMGITLWQEIGDKMLTHHKFALYQIGWELEI